MFPLPRPGVENCKKWHGSLVESDPFVGYSVVWPALCISTKMSKSSLEPKYIFILRQGNIFKYAYHDKDGFKEIPEKWYSKCFVNITEVPQENIMTINLYGVFTEVPFLPDNLFKRKISTKRRKKTHHIVHDVVFPTWKHQEGKSIHFKVAKNFKEIFDKADSGEIELMDPFAGYSSIEEINNSKTGRQAFRTVAGFIYHQCRDNLGYPVEL